jgi:hypothetical protein
MRFEVRVAVALWLCGISATIQAQTDPVQVRRILESPISNPGVVAYQLRTYLLRKAPQLPRFESAQSWSAEASRLRKDILEKIVFHGWPPEWVNAPTRFEEVSSASVNGYRMHKLRYEIVPGMYGAAILYEPLKITGKVPAILNVNGHVGPPGKAIEYKQKRCINQALQGMLSLNLEWFAYGELDNKENAHWFGAHLDLAGANGVGLFYLAMRRGLDYLESHSNVDRTRLGVTGLSGGGWQTIFLSALDERVAVSVPVAGYSSVISRIERPGDVGDVEQNPTDLLTLADYPLLTAMRAPRPTLLAYNAEDDCCFRAALVKPYIFDFVRPAFALFDREGSFDWHTNIDPGNHNYQADNRLASYRFFAKHFKLGTQPVEVDVSHEVQTREQLVVGLPAENLSVLGLARKLAASRRPVTPPSMKHLSTVVRYTKVDVQHAWRLTNSYGKGLESQSLRFDFGNGLSANAVWLSAIGIDATRSPVTIVLNDAGRAASNSEISDRLNRGERVLAMDLLFMGDAAPQGPGASSYSQLFATLGERPLGLLAAQLNAATRWATRQYARGPLRLSTTGARTQVVALVAAALERDLYESLEHHDGLVSLQTLFDKPIEYTLTPELFCLDFFRDFAIPQLTKLTRH